MSRCKELIKHILPKKVTFSVDGINGPCYNLDIAGGVLMSNKNKMTPVNNNPAEMPVIGKVAEEMSNAYKDLQTTRCKESDNMASVIRDSNVSDDIRNRVIDYETQKMMIRHEQKMIIIRNVTASVIILIGLAGLGIASGTAVKLYKIKYAA